MALEMDILRSEWSVSSIAVGVLRGLWAALLLGLFWGIIGAIWGLALNVDIVGIASVTAIIGVIIGALSGQVPFSLVGRVNGQIGSAIGSVGLFVWIIRAIFFG